MSSDKRRKARIQGGWASDTKGRGPRSDASKPKMPAHPTWTDKNVDCGAMGQKFVYQEPTEKITEKAKPRVIEKPGVYDISTEPGGVSRIRLFPNFIEPKESHWMFDQLHSELPWRQRSDVKEGVEYLQPRLTAWFGDFPYSYSGVRHEGNNNWTPTLSMLKERLEETTGLRFNSVLANLYRDGHDHVPWHSDDEKSLGHNPTIASLTFGDLRLFEMRKKPPPELRAKAKEEGYEYTDIVQVPLDSGTLLIMEGASQDDWQHRIKKEYHDRGPRINLTFRVIYPEED